MSNIGTIALFLGVAIAGAIRGPLRFCPDLREHANASLKVTLRNILDQFRAQLMGGIENLIEHCFRAALKMDDFAAAIFGRTAALDPAVILETVEQAREGGAFDPHPLSNFFLGKFVSALGEMNERPPLTLAQSERAEPLVQLCPPGAGRAEEDQAELIAVWRWHGQNWLAC